MQRDLPRHKLMKFKENRVFQWGGSEYSPMIYVCEYLLGISAKKGMELSKKIDTADYGCCNFCGVEERDLSTIFDDTYYFNPLCTEERLCVDLTLVTLIAEQLYKETLGDVKEWFVPRLRVIK